MSSKLQRMKLSGDDRVSTEWFLLLFWFLYCSVSGLWWTEKPRRDLHILPRVFNRYGCVYVCVHYDVLIRIKCGHKNKEIPHISRCLWEDFGSKTKEKTLLIWQ